jgi:peptidoglycan hydrolase CwlO-like protein
LFPPAQQARPQTAEANCAECDKRQQSLTQQTEDMETRLNSRIGRLENQLKESMAQTEELRTLLMKSSQETVRLQHEVMECKGTIAQMQADFKRQQLEDLKSLESLSNSLRTVLTAEAEQESSEVIR